MIRYFKTVEIDADEFEKVTGEDIEYSYQLAIPVDKTAFVALDEDAEDEIQIPLDCFD